MQKGHFDQLLETQKEYDHQTFYILQQLRINYRGNKSFDGKSVEIINWKAKAL